MEIKRPQANKKPIDIGDTIKVSDLSPETVEVLQHFGLEAPELLNKYCIALEDALIEQVKKRKEAIDLVKELQATIVKIETNDTDERNS